MDNVNNIISIPAWDDPLPIYPAPRREIREQIVSAATELPEVQNLRRTLAARYALRYRVGEGHFSTLFTACESQLHREVLVKLLRTPKRVHHFRTAVTKVAHASDHTNMLSVYASYLDRDPPHYVVRYVSGKPIHRILDELGDRRVPIDFVRELITTVGLAISHAHRHDARNLNIKPCNIIVSDYGDRLKRNFFLNLNSYDETAFLADEDWCANRDDILYIPLEYRRESPYLERAAKV